MPTLLSLLLLLLPLTSSASHHHHHHHHHRTTKPTIIPSSASHHQHHHHRTTKPAIIPSSTTSQISNACNATRFRTVCMATLSNSTLPPNPTTLDLFLAALNSSVLNLATATTNAKSILAASAANPNRTNAAHNCIEFLSYSSKRLISASTAASTSSFPDARAFAGAALLYQYDCWSALKYVNGTQQVADAMTQVILLTNLTSNALCMLTAWQRFGADVSLWGPPQTERDGYWGSTGHGSGVNTVAFPSRDAANATVCIGGSCEYATVQAAVDAAPEFGEGRFVIYVRAGVYKESVRVGFEKTNVVLIGDGQGKTVITGALSADMVGVSTYNTATVGVTGDGFMARGLTIQNTAGPDSHQAVAFRSDSDLSVLDSVEFVGHQDTLYAHSLRQYYRNCLISGTVDFIFGNSASVFDSCNITIVPRLLNPTHGEVNTVTAHGRTDPAQPTGFVLNNCVITGSADYSALYRANPVVHRSYLGRPWKEYSRTVMLNCYLSEIIRPEGWSVWIGDFALNTLFYGEFGSKGPEGNTTARVGWSSQVPAEHVVVYSVENFIQGNQWIPQ